jgi:hypothetical protein
LLGEKELQFGGQFSLEFPKLFTGRLGQEHPIEQAINCNEGFPKIVYLIHTSPDWPDDALMLRDSGLAVTGCD